MERNKENVIEWFTGSDRMLCSFTQKKYINRIKRMAKNHGELVEIVAENKDGSITARIPLRALHLTIYGAKNSEACKEDGGDHDVSDDMAKG